jgi:hypothetical protein
MKESDDLDMPPLGFQPQTAIASARFRLRLCKSFLFLTPCLDLLYPRSFCSITHQRFGKGVSQRSRNAQYCTPVTLHHSVRSC